MALTYPYPLAFLSDYLAAQTSTPSVVRNDQMSGVGTGQFWAAELAPPIWQFDLPLVVRRPNEARAIDAKIWALGVNKSFLFADPGYSGPVDGAPGSLVKVGTISATRDATTLTGLPANFTVTVGDRLSIAWGTDRYYFGTFAEGGDADGSGNLAEVAIFPALPLSIATGDAVEMAIPRLKAIVPPGGYTPFTARPGFIGQGATLKLLQKV